MRIDVSRFVQLTFALAALACDHPAPRAAPPPQPSAIQQGPSAPSEASAVPSETPAASDTVEGPPQGVHGDAPESAGEAPANLSVCRKLSPSCEGMMEECLSLSAPSDPSGEGGWSQGFRPRVAEEIAACWNSNVRPPNCRTRALGNCVKQAVLRATLDRTVDPLCDSLQNECRQAGKKATWSKDLCAHILSAMMPGPAQSEAQNILRVQCTHEYVLPYQPFRHQ